jgi:hypothetical protein
MVKYETRKRSQGCETQKPPQEFTVHGGANQEANREDPAAGCVERQHEPPLRIPERMNQFGHADNEGDDRHKLAPC